MYNLLQEEWIPVKRAAGEQPAYISPSEVTEGSAANPVRAPAAPRPDFNGALLQFLIGLVQTACPPRNETEWQEKFRCPPCPEELDAAFKRYADAFNLDGTGPRFMQDLDLTKMDGEWKTIDHLLIEMPGEQTLEKNTDHFQKRGTVKTICQSCCTMALFTLQTNAPAGGRGHRTSLRGGGPLTTLVTGRTLWETIWLNVIPREALGRYGNDTMCDGAGMFPWLGHTRTSGKNEITTPRDVHPVQMFWGMPRRVRLVCETRTEAVPCDLCGRPVHDRVSRYYDKSYGIHYKGGWQHILSPSVTDRRTGESRSRHGQPGCISYRNRLGYIQDDPEKDFTREPAVVVRLFREERASAFAEIPGSPFRLFAFGYDMDNMKARGWYEGSLPLGAVDRDIRAGYEDGVSRMIQTADLIVFNVRVAVKKALVAPGTAVSGDLSVIDDEFWQDTEPDFYAMAGELQEILKENLPLTSMKLRWLSLLTQEGEMLFDRYSQSNIIARANPERIARARIHFTRFSSLQNKKIRELLDLETTPLQDLAGTPEIVRH